VPFIALNCSAIPKDLMESEIFGHVRGAFTGASEARTGAAELADGGLLFLDEIAEMDLALQAKLLRFVQTGQFRRVGGTDATSVHVRIVSATNRDPTAETSAGRLRADLFHRLYVLPLHMPPLRHRGDDLLHLADAFLHRFAAEEARTFTGFTAEAAAALHDHSWPGNVRELANAVRRAVVLNDGPLVTRGMLLEPAAQPRREDASGTPHPVASYRDQERSIIEEAVKACGGNIARAAVALGISPATIYRKRNAWRAPQPA
jgi:two-component system repressor protein LuxO